MRKRYLTWAAAFVAGTIVIVLGVLVGAVYRATRREVKVTVPQVDHDIRDHLPIGSSRAEVETYLNDKKIWHVYVNEPTHGVHNNCEDDGERNNCEVATIYDAAHGGLVRTDIQIFFNFDKKLKLISCSLKESYTGP
jgi:hypothetical protein